MKKFSQKIVARVGLVACVAVALAVVLMGSAQAETNLLTNGSFETGTLASWTLDPQSLGNTSAGVYSGVYCCQGALPIDGTFATTFGPGGAFTGEIAQAFATTPGWTYTGSLLYAGVGGPGDGNVTVTLVDVNTLTALDGPAILPQPGFNGAWSTYNFSFVATGVLSAIDILSPTGGGTDYLVDAVYIVPEPSSLALIAVGTVGLLARRRRRK